MFINQNIISCFLQVEIIKGMHAPHRCSHSLSLCLLPILTSNRSVTKPPSHSKYKIRISRRSIR